MPRKPADFALEPNWHLDFRDLLSLPEDRVVRVRFLINTCSGAAALILLVLAGWQVYARANVLAQLHFWDERIATHQPEFQELQLVLRDYMAEAAKIKDAYEIIHTPFVASAFVLNIGRTLPQRMTVDTMEFADNAVTIHGSLAAPPEQASRVVGSYVETLRHDPKIGPLFSDISAPSLDRAREENLFNFVIVLKLR